MTDLETTVAALKEPMRAFAARRRWEPFHSPKNLVLALASEVGELAAVVRWMTPEESWKVAEPGSATAEAFADELADVANIVLLLSSHTGVDLAGAIGRKMLKNERKYPAPVD